MTKGGVELVNDQTSLSKDTTPARTLEAANICLVPHILPHRTKQRWLGGSRSSPCRFIADRKTPSIVSKI